MLVSVFELVSVAVLAAAAAAALLSSPAEPERTV